MKVYEVCLIVFLHEIHGTEDMYIVEVGLLIKLRPVQVSASLRGRSDDAEMTFSEALTFLSKSMESSMETLAFFISSLYCFWCNYVILYSQR